MAKEFSTNEAFSKHCEICFKLELNVPAISYCDTCCQSFCDNCSKQHRIINLTSSHALDAIPSVGNATKRTYDSFCQDHPPVKMELVCNDCKKVMCSQFRELFHKDHLCPSIKEAAIYLKEKLEFTANAVLKRIDAIDQNIEMYEALEAKYANISKEKLESISKEASALIRLIMNNEERLQMQVTSVVETEMEKSELEKSKLMADSLRLRQYLSDINDKYILWTSANQLLSEYYEIWEETVKKEVDIDIQHFQPFSQEELRKELLDESKRTVETGKIIPLPEKKEIDQKLSVYNIQQLSLKPMINGSVWSLHSDVQSSDRGSTLSLPSRLISGRRDNLISLRRSRERIENMDSEPEMVPSLPPSLIRQFNQQLLPSMISLPSKFTLSRVKEKSFCPPSRERNETVDSEPHVATPKATLVRSDDAQTHLKIQLMGKICVGDVNSVRGVTAFESNIYVITLTSEFIQVFDSVSLKILTLRQVNGLKNPSDISVCKQNRCLYICDWDKKGIFKVPVNPEHKTIFWKTDESVGGISVTHYGNVISACFFSQMIKEYESNGKLIKQITLENGIHPQHAVKSSSGDFVFCHFSISTGLYRVCLAGSDGKIKALFVDEDRGSGEGRLNGPTNLAVDKKGRVFVAEYLNNRILLLDSSLKFLAEIISKSTGDIHRPDRIFLDEEADRLYLADNDLKKSSKPNKATILVYNVMESPS